MNLLSEIYQSYIASTECLASREENYFADPLKSRVMVLNDCAFFVLLFGQIEGLINYAYEQFIGPWEGVPFRHQVNLLFEEDVPTSEIIIDYYKTRCDIAHGRIDKGLSRGSINVPETYQKLRAIMSELRK